MRKFEDTRVVPVHRFTRRLQWFAAAVVLLPLVLSSSAHAGEPFVGVDIGASKPTNNFYRRHVSNGATANPFAGYMLNKYLGAEGQLHFTFQEPKEDFDYSRSTQTTSLFGFTVGPRIALPLDQNFEFYGTGQGGFFTGMSGALTHTSGGLSAGGGLDYNLSLNWKLGLYGRWNHAFQSPRPTTLMVPPDQQGPTDAEWVTGGISVRYQFAQPPPALPPPPKVAEAPPPPPPVKKKIVLRAVHFDTDKSDIRQDAVPILDEAAQILKDEGTVAVIVAGHTDSRASDEYNQKLSERRADAVKKYLVDHGIAASRIKSIGYGETKPVATNDTADGRQQNRRVELDVE